MNFGVKSIPNRAPRPIGKFACRAGWRRCLLTCVVIASGPLPAAEFDVVIRRGRVIDGTGNPWTYSDVAIKGDRIAAVGRIPAGTGAREIDATGFYVTPGFVDPHSHSF